MTIPAHTVEPAPAPAPATPESFTPPHLAERILSARADLEGERKHVTVLFADIKGSTELIEGLDPEAAQAILAPAVSAMIEAIHRFEGTVCRVMGDGIMALFGAPLAHEDHATRACYAALTMQESIRRYCEQTRERDGVEVLARVGLNSGEVVVGSISNDLHVEYTAIGPTVHLAARMEQLAREGTARLTAETLRLVEGLVEIKPLGKIPVKGLVEPVEAFELVAATPGRRRFHVTAGRGLTPFVGRQAELDALQRALDLARDGHGQIGAPVGEPGVGKSRLVYEFVHSHRTAGWLVLESGSVSYGRATLWLPVIDFLKAYCHIEPADDPRTAREKLTGKLLTLDRALETILAPLLTLLDLPTDDPAWAALDPPRRRQATLDALQRLLLRESQEQPLLLVFEDLHWIDSETQALLDMLVDTLPTARILLLVNYRPEYTHTWGNKSYYTQLRIDPLEQASADELLDVLVGSPSARSEQAALMSLKALLIARTQGNPFFLEESIHTLVETGALIGERGAYRLTRPVEEVRVPGTVQAVLAARIDRLPTEEKRLLQTASVIGKDVPFALLQAIADTPEAGLQAGLSHLQAAELLYAVSLFPDLEYTFKHALTHEVAYSSLLLERRKALHARVVEAIETLYPQRLDEHVERLAHHAARGEIWEQAANYLFQAGERALTRSSHREAASWFEQTLAAQTSLPETPEVLAQAVDVRLEMRTALMPLGELDRLLDNLHQAEALASRLGDQRRLCRVLSLMTNGFWWQGDYEQAIGVGERARAFADDLGDLQLRVVSRETLANPCISTGNHRRVVELLSWLVDAITPDLVGERFGMAGHPTVAARSRLASSLAALGEFDRGLAFGDEAIRIADALDYAFSQAYAVTHQAQAQNIRGGFQAAAVLAARGVELAQLADLPVFTFSGEIELSNAHTLAGRPAEARLVLRRAGEMPLLRTQANLQARYYLALAKMNAAAGHLDEATEAARTTLEMSVRRRERAHEAEARRLLGEIAARREPSAVEEAEQRYREALALADELGMRPLQAHCHLGLGKLLARVGRRDEARGELTTAISLLSEMEMTHWLPEADAELAGLATTVASAEQVS